MQNRSLYTMGIMLMTALFLISEASPCLAQKADKTVKSKQEVNAIDTIYKLNTLTVTARIRRQDIIKPQQLSGKELKSLNSLNVADALRYFSGVQIKDYGGIGGIKTVNVRSMGSHHVGIFYDGIELSNAQNGQVDLGQYSLDNMESVEVYNGQKSTPLQPAKDFGSSGSVYMQTRKPVFDTDRNYNLKFNVKTGSFALINPSILWEQRISNTLSSSFSCEGLNSDGKYKFRYKRVFQDGSTAYDTTATRQNGDIWAFRMEENLFGRLPSGQWKAKVYHYQSERGIPGAIVNNVWRRGERLWDNNTFAQAMLQTEVTERYSLKAIAKYAYYKTRYINKDPKLLYVDNRYRQQELYGSIANAYSLSEGWHISLAYDFQWNKLTSDMTEFAYPTRQLHLVALATTYRSSKVNLQASLLGTFAKDHTKLRGAEPWRDDFSPSAMISYKPFDNINLRFNGYFKGSLRMPTFNDLYYADIGNSGLKPERTKQYDLGVQYSIFKDQGIFRGLDAKIDGYYNRITNKIIAYPKGQQFRWTMLNLGKVDIKGLDIVLTNRLEPIKDLIITLKGQYTYQKAIDVTNPKDTYYHNQIPYIPWHSGSLITMVNYKGWQLNYSFVYVGERYNQQENTIYNYTEPWYTNDISIGKDIAFKDWGMRIQLECNNLLNQDYDVILNYPMPKRNYRLTIAFNI